MAGKARTRTAPRGGGAPRDVERHSGACACKSCRPGPYPAPLTEAELADSEPLTEAEFHDRIRPLQIYDTERLLLLWRRWKASEILSAVEAGILKLQRVDETLNRRPGRHSGSRGDSPALIERSGLMLSLLNGCLAEALRANREARREPSPDELAAVVLEALATPQSIVRGPLAGRIEIFLPVFLQHFRRELTREDLAKLDGADAGARLRLLHRTIGSLITVADQPMKRGISERAFRITQALWERIGPDELHERTLRKILAKYREALRPRPQLP